MRQYVPVVGVIIIKCLTPFLLPRQGLIFIANNLQFYQIAQDTIIIEICIADRCKLSRPELDIKNDPFLHYCSNIPKITEQIVDMSDLDVR